MNKKKFLIEEEFTRNQEETFNSFKKQVGELNKDQYEVLTLKNKGKDTTFTFYDADIELYEMLKQTMKTYFPFIHIFIKQNK